MEMSVRTGNVDSQAAAATSDRTFSHLPTEITAIDFPTFHEAILIIILECCSTIAKDILNKNPFIDVTIVSSKSFANNGVPEMIRSNTYREKNFSPVMIII
ncbi:unnamed protein product [Arctia plantaginis]|uniref:Uncharacterized protein n=1 Tax=Arctia plantaginis TaxID=874455 RepID=A0A8S1A667_ARCPL|nr:unnamed protein product [Arctia plantaginis]